jgi:uncharacterized protein
MKEADCIRLECGTLHPRQWPVPDRPWVMKQVWNDLLFAHWPLPVEVLRPVVPAALPLDTWDGQAWIGVVPFWMSGVRPRWVPPLPRFSTFPELNVRTYVTVGGKPGVYFFSLDARNPIAVAAARLGFNLPYFNARMSTWWRNEWVEYRSARTHRDAHPATLIGHYRPTGDVQLAEPGSLADFLTARYALYTVRGTSVSRLEIDHVAWPLQPAEADFETNTMLSQLGLAVPGVPPLLHFARKMEMVGWLPERV